MTHEGGACLQIGSTHKIKPAGMSEHVRMNSQGREFGKQFEPVEHPPKRGRLHPEHTIGGTQPFPQWAEEALVLLRQGMFT